MGDLGVLEVLEVKASDYTKEELAAMVGNLKEGTMLNIIYDDEPGEE